MSILRGERMGKPLPRAMDRESSWYRSLFGSSNSLSVFLPLMQWVPSPRRSEHSGCFAP